jgi:Xaa-Pro dipeptidase
MFDLARIQQALAEQNLDGWLLYDFRGSNVLARRVLELPDDQMGSRRCLYFIPREGEPRKLVHRIESGVFDHLPGEKAVFLKWQELEAGVESLVSGCSRLGMEYSPRNANPYISRVDAGTIELVRSFGCEIVPSGDLIQSFEATWDADQWAMHQEAAVHTNSAFTAAL